MAIQYKITVFCEACDFLSPRDYKYALLRYMQEECILLHYLLEECECE